VAPTLTATATLRGIEFNGRRVLAVPNPGSRQMRFLFNFERAGDVQVKIYSVSGELVASLHSAGLASGATVNWDCDGVARGIYLVRVLQDGREVDRLKIALVR
jgi:hypothetical protein